MQDHSVRRVRVDSADRRPRLSFQHNALRGDNVAGATGLEPATSYVTGRRSLPLNYGLAGRSADKQLCYSRGIVNLRGLRGYAMSVLRPQPIAEQEKEARARRERFVQNAVANVRLEGLEPSPKALEIWQRYIEGEVSVDQAGELIRALPTRV